MALSLTRSAIALGVFAGGSLLVLAGCEMAGRTASTGPATVPAKSAVAAKGGAELWADTCSHCHNLRSPSTYGPAQWEVAVYDMRVRANLTGEEQRKILEFLKAASQ